MKKGHVKLVPKGTAKNPVRGRLVPKAKRPSETDPVKRDRGPFRRNYRKLG